MNHDNDVGIIDDIPIYRDIVVDGFRRLAHGLTDDDVAGCADDMSQFFHGRPTIDRLFVDIQALQQSLSSSRVRRTSRSWSSADWLMFSEVLMSESRGVMQ